MKRLLLAPLLIAGLQSPASALPWGNDIVVKTDVGEKIIVKDSTVKTKPISTDDVADARQKYTPVEECIDRQKIIRVISDYSCQRIYEREKEKYPEDWIEYDNEVDYFRKAGLKSFGTEVTFRPIFVDLNNKKIVGGYKTLFCPNNDAIFNTFSLEKEDDILFYLYALKKAGDYQFLDPRSTIAMDQVKIKLCNKYAKF